MFNKETRTKLRMTDKAVIIDLIGDVTNQGEEAIKTAYAQAVEENPQRIFFNFADTEYINTSGIAVLISLVMEAQKTEYRIGLYGMSAHYRKVFELVRFPLYADMYPTEEDALATV